MHEYLQEEPWDFILAPRYNEGKGKVPSYFTREYAERAMKR